MHGTGRPRAIVVGDVMTDVIVRPEGPLVPGSDRRARIGLYHGGSGANQASWLAAAGVPTTFVGRVGRADHEAQSARLAAGGVDPHLAADETRSTGMLVTMLAADGERSFLTDRGANDGLVDADFPEELLSGVGLVHISGYSLFASGPRAAVSGFAERARARGITVTVDPASTGFLREVGASAFLEWSRFASICFPNAEEAATLAGTEDLEAQRALLSAHYGFAVIKRGGDGAEAISADGQRWSVPAPRVDVVDTTGAGDAFFGGYVAALLAGEGIEACLSRGVAAGSRAVTVLGGRAA